MRKSRLDDDPECRAVTHPGREFCRKQDAEEVEWEYRCPVCNTEVSFAEIKDPCGTCTFSQDELCDGLEPDGVCNERMDVEAASPTDRDEAGAASD